MENKEVAIRFRVSPELRDAWAKACNKNAHNGSELLRRYIKEYIEKSGVELPKE